MGTEEHVFEYSPNFFADSPYTVLPECSCGWMGRGVSSVDDAQEAWENHCDVVGTRYLELVASPHHEDLGNPSWWRLAEVDACFEAGELAASSIEKFLTWWEQADAMFKASASLSLLPEEPNTAAINDLLVDIRRRMW